MLRDEVEEFTRLSGEDGAHTSICRIGSYLDGYHRAMKWIPVTERLPDGRDWYLGIFQELDTGWTNPVPFICEYVGRDTGITTSDHWILKDHDNPNASGFEYYRKLRCVAWMELPEPYKEER